MLAHLKFRTIFLVLGALMAASIILIIFASSMGRIAHKTSRDAADLRYNSYLLAGELRQSSDDLTRLGRTFAVTGNPLYEQEYFDVLDIRNGKKPRPVGYNRIYWDFMAVGTKPRPDGEAVALQTLMQQAGFTDAEFAKLKEAQANSDGLVKLETVAMNAVKGQFDDGAGNFTKKGAPDLELARRLTHSPEYHQYKATIMKPIDDFFGLVDQRTSEAVNNARVMGDFWDSVIVASVLLLIGVGAVVSLLVYRRVIRPVEALKDVMLALSNGDLDIRLTRSIDGDEISQMSNALISLKDHMAEAEQMRSAKAAEQAAREKRAIAVESLLNEFGQSVAVVLDRTMAEAREMQSTATEQAELSSQTNAQLMTVATTSDHATANVNAVAAAAEQLSSSINEISHQVVEAARVSGNASEEAARTNVMVQALSHAADRIGEVVRLINDIASQTNLLALNATIEAARAGDAGKGFAVVANEVKHLANQTARATEEIGGQVSAVQEETKRAVEAIKTIATVIDKVREISAGIAGAVEQQGAATQEIARNVNQAAMATQEVSRNIGGLTEAAKSTGLVADKTRNSAHTLSKDADHLRDEVRQFLTKARAF